MAGKLTKMEEILLRQIHPNSLQNGEPASDRFRPSKMDNNKLSTDRGSMTSPADSHKLYTSNGRQSAAVFGLTVGEFEAEKISCEPDPIKDDPELPDNPAHALADYSIHDPKKQKVIAKRLKQLAVARGCLHPTASDT